MGAWPQATATIVTSTSPKNARDERDDYAGKDDDGDDDEEGQLAT